MSEVDFDRLLEASDKLMDYEGVLPLLIRSVILKKWSDNLNKKGLWVQINKECVNTKPKSYTDSVKELENWCKSNPQYKDLIKKK